MQVHVCVCRMEIPDSVHITFGHDKYFIVSQVQASRLVLTFINAADMLL